MASYLDMQTRIADELDRSDLTAQIKKAIVSSVAYYAKRNFWFTQSSFSFSTVQGQRTYTSADAAEIATSPNIEVLNGFFNGSRDQITKRSFEDIDNRTSQLTSYGQPEDWAYRAQTIWFYPIPDAVYTITAYYIPTLTALSADTDENVWTEEAEELIRSRAKIDLIRNVIRGTDMAEELAMLAVQERDALNALITETASREATGFSRPTIF